MKTPDQVMGQIRNVILNILNGRYEHKQDYWHCGTAACIAGWCQLEDVKEQTNKSFLEIQTAMMGCEVIEGYDNAENHVLKNITNKSLKADIKEYIFDAHITIEEIVSGFNKVIKKHSIDVLPVIVSSNVESSKVKVKVKV